VQVTALAIERAWALLIDLIFPNAMFSNDLLIQSSRGCRILVITTFEEFSGMKSRRLFILAGFSFATVSVLGCAKETATQSAPTPPAVPASSPIATTPQSPAPAQGTSSSPASSKAIVLRSGSFVTGEHPTQGAAQIVTQNNQRRLELNSAFSTSTSGPDLFVVLHRSANVIGSTTPPDFPIKAADYVVLAPLQSYSGAQSYAIPDSINLDDFQSVAIWCRRFNATFGAALLKPGG
jgi:Electron transfer DM13